MIDSILDHVGGLPAPALIILVFLLAYGETAMFLDLVVPGEIGLVVIGAASATGEVSLLALCAGAVLGATLGDTTSYALGRWLTSRDRAHDWLDRRPRLSTARERAASHFERHGSATVLVGRWIGALRAVVPFVAGTAAMPFRRFLKWNALASITWATTMVSIGRVFGRDIAGAVDAVDRWLTVAIVALIGVFVLKAWRGRATRAPSRPSHPA